MSITSRIFWLMSADMIQYDCNLGFYDIIILNKNS